MDPGVTALFRQSALVARSPRLQRDQTLAQIELLTKPSQYEK
jgi:hypothetical protein